MRAYAIFKSGLIRFIKLSLSVFPHPNAGVGLQISIIKG
jgi:hypothetical protein